MSSPFGIFEAFVPVHILVADVPILGLRGWWSSFWKTKQESQEGIKDLKSWTTNIVDEHSRRPVCDSEFDPGRLDSI